MPRFKAVIFDWDGTLFDSTQACFEVYTAILPRFGVPSFSFENFRESFKANYKQFYLDKGVPKQKLPEVDDLWREVFSEKEDSIPLFPFVQPLLTSLFNGDLKLALVSNGDGFRVRRELGKHGIFDAFHCIVTKDEVKDFKPSPEGIEFALESLKVPASKSIYIGDMADDIKAGRKAGVLTAGVLTGLHGRKRLEEEEPDFLMQDASAVLDIL